ncbi:MAG: hydrogenase maturation nickel metallochaperone HypA [Hyphomicrobium sp.]
MHELGITRNIVAIVAEHAAGRRVTRVALDVGRLSGVMSDAIRFAFDVVAAGTQIEGATLDIRDIDGRGRCRTCALEFATTTLYAPCPCGSRDVDRIAGEELKVREYEFDTPASDGPKPDMLSSATI